MLWLPVVAVYAPLTMWLFRAMYRARDPFHKSLYELHTPALDPGATLWVSPPEHAGLI